MADQPPAAAKDNAPEKRRGPVVVSVINLKGGVGKTTVVTLLARHAAEIGLNVLAVDLDPQANLSQALMREDDYVKFMEKKEPSIVELFNGYLPPSPERDAPSDLNSVAKTLSGWKYHPASPYHLIPSRFDFSDNLVRSAIADTRVLARFIAKEMANKDLVLIDCAPTESVLTRMAYHASRYILIPARTEIFSVIGFPLLKESLEKFKADNPAHEIDVCGVLINRTKTKGVRLGPHHRESLKKIKARAGKYGWPIMNTKMNLSDGYPKLMMEQHPDWVGDAKVNARNIAEEFMKMMGLQRRH